MVDLKVVDKPEVKREWQVGERGFRLTPLGQAEIPLYLVEIEIARVWGSYVAVREVESKQVYNLFKDKMNTLYRTAEEVRAEGLRHFDEMRDRLKKAEKDFKGMLAAIKSEGNEDGRP